MSKLKPVAFTHLMITLIVLKSKLALGRYALAGLLQTTKAKARVILEVLNEFQITGAHGKSSGRTGNFLTNKGHQLMEVLDQIFTVVLPEDESFKPNPLIFHEVQIHLYLKSDVKLGSGLYERDIAVRGGASGAVTFVNNNGVWRYPDSNNLVNSDVSFPDPDYTAWICVFGNFEKDCLGGISRLIDYFYFDQVQNILSNYGIEL